MVVIVSLSWAVVTSEAAIESLRGGICYSDTRELMGEEGYLGEGLTER